VVLTHRKGQYKMNVTPMFTKEDHAKELARFDWKLERFNKIKKDREQKLAVLNAQADIRRSFGIAGFGTYNCDRFRRNPNTWTLNLTLDMPTDFAGLTETELDVYHIAGNNRMVIPYKLNDLGVFNYFPEDQNYLVALMPDKTIAVVSPEDFKQVNLKLQRNQEHPQNFKMQQVQHQINHSADLRLALGI